MLFTLLYADDTVILADSPEQLQASLNGMHNYCNDWKLEVNVSKTKIVVHSRGKVRKKPTFYFGGSPIEMVDDYCYLGITMNYNSRFDQGVVIRTPWFDKAIKKQCEQASRAMYSLLKKITKLHLPVDLALHLFDSLVTPILLYGCEIWGFSNIEQVERVHLKFCKAILKVNKSTPSCMVYGELGRLPLSIAISSRMVCYWAKIVNSHNGKLSKVMLNFLLQLSHTEVYQSPWLLHVKKILDNCGLSFYWQSNVKCNTVYLKQIVKQVLTDQYRQSWLGYINTNPKCISYKTFKDEMKMETYIL